METHVEEREGEGRGEERGRDRERGRETVLFRASFSAEL
jgi:hypothetical protein